jgi:acyl-CoA thioester hydrolase
VTIPAGFDPRTLARTDFDVLWPVTTRWADNDMFGHLNNAVYYQLFDTAINGWIEQSTGIDPMTTAARAVVAQSSCRYFTEVHFPQPLTVAVRTARLGRTSVTYEVALFGADGPLVAFGEWVHVYVDRDTSRPVPIPAVVRALTESAATARS